MTGYHPLLALVFATSLAILRMASAMPVQNGSSTALEARAWSSTKDCPAGASWKRVRDPLTRQNTQLWTVADYGAGLAWNTKGLTMKVTKPKYQATVQSTSKWYPPVSVSFRAKTKGYPGIVNSLCFRDGESTVNSEIDLEIVTDQFQIPLWSPQSGRAHRLEVGSEVGERMGNGTVRAKDLIPTYGYRYKGFNPKVHTNYRVEWLPKSVKWTIGDKDRVQFKKKQDKLWPKGPLYLRFGPWGTGEENYWAGRINWKAHPEASFHIKDMVIEGCQAD